jgi:hypothetical protein
VALTANPKLLQHSSAVRFTMAFSASQHGPMLLGMALGTTKGCVSGIALREYFNGIAMTNRTYLIRCVLWIHNLKGFVRWVARQTLGLGHLFRMRLMAFHAFRGISMVGVMTGGAIQVCVVGYVRLYLFIYLRMAYITPLLQVNPRRDFQGGVDLAVAPRTSCQVWPVYLAVTPITFRQDLFIIHSRTVDVKPHMASPAVYPVPAAPHP